MGNRTLTNTHITLQKGEENMKRQNEFYLFFRDRVFIKPVANKYWKERYEMIDEKIIWKNRRMKYVDPTLENFNFLQRHNSILTEMRLLKIGLETTALCRVCNLKEESLLHLFFYCNKLKDFMDKMKKVVKK